MVMAIVFTSSIRCFYVCSSYDYSLLLSVAVIKLCAYALASVTVPAAALSNDGKSKNSE